MFNKILVLERILREAPILSNLRGEIEINFNEEINKVPIYAYYCNRGVKDPELSYDRENNPIKTNPNHTLVEIYSFWEGSESKQKLVKRLENEGRIKKGEIIYQGPWIDGEFDDLDIFKMTRDIFCPYQFLKSAYEFMKHFNKIVKDFGYDLELLDLTENDSEFYKEGAYGIKSKRMLNYSINGEVKENLIENIAPILINLNDEDPSLSSILDLIEDSYKRIKSPDFLEKSIIFS